MARERLPADGLLVLGKQTGQGFGFVASNGENFLAVFPGANSLVGARHVQAQAGRIREADLVCATFESPDDAILEVFSIARAAGVRALLNPSPWRLWSPELLAVTDTLILLDDQPIIQTRGFFRRSILLSQRSSGPTVKIIQQKWGEGLGGEQEGLWWLRDNS